MGMGWGDRARSVLRFLPGLVEKHKTPLPGPRTGLCSDIRTGGLRITINLLTGIIVNFTVHVRDSVPFLILVCPVSVSRLLVFRPKSKFCAKYVSTLI
jgi:hypothetical protein